MNPVVRAYRGADERIGELGMNAMRNWMLGAGVTLVLASGMAPSTAQAALVDRGGGMIYDTTLNITWLADVKYAQTSGYDADGRLNWADANIWAANLVYGGFDNWRLPTVGSIGPAFNLDFSNNGTTDLGTAKTTTGGNDGGWRDAAGVPVSELGHMFYVNLANKGQCITNDADPASCVMQADFGLVDDPANLNDESLFINLDPFTRHVTGTAYAPIPTAAWYFRTAVGLQELTGQGAEGYAWAVRPGDVLAVPEPASAQLILLGLASLGGLRHRRLSA